MARQLGPSLVSARVVAGASPTKVKAPTGVEVPSDLPWMVGSAREVAQQHGGKLRQHLGFGALMNKILASGGTFIGDSIPCHRCGSLLPIPNKICYQIVKNRIKMEKGINPHVKNMARVYPAGLTSFGVRSG